MQYRYDFSFEDGTYHGCVDSENQLIFKLFEVIKLKVKYPYLKVQIIEIQSMEIDSYNIEQHIIITKNIKHYNKEN